MSKSLKDVPPETLERWKHLSRRQFKKTKPKRIHLPNVPSNSKIPSLHLLRAETEKLKIAENPEAVRDIQDRISELHAKVMQEGEAMRKVVMEQVENLKLHRMMAFTPNLVPTLKRYKCPKCKREWSESQLNYAKGKHKKKVPWCPHCNLQVFPLGHEALKHPVIPIRDNRLQLEFKRLGLDF